MIARAGGLLALRDGLPARPPADRRRLVRDARRRRSRRSRCSRASSSCATPRSATRRRCSPALVLWAFERHLDGRRDHALYLAFAGALLRPEVWPFLGLYGLWLWFAEPRLRSPPRGARRARARALVPARVVGLGRPVPRGRPREQPEPGQRRRSPSIPALELVSRFRKVVIAPVKVGIIIGVALRARDVDPAPRARALTLARGARRRSPGSCSWP